MTLPEDASAGLPSRGQVAVEGAINGHLFQTVLEPDGKRGHWLKLDKRLQDAARSPGRQDGVARVEPTRRWPEPDIPQDFRAALADAPDISELWRDITSMARWEWVRWINATKNPGTRARRVEVAISKLRSGKRRPCCFDLSACTDPDLSNTLNRITTPLAKSGHGPFSLIRHVGRKTGRSYETPVILAKVPEGFVAELTYGENVNWYRNAIAAGGCVVLSPAGSTRSPRSSRTTARAVGRRTRRHSERPRTHRSQRLPTSSHRRSARRFIQVTFRRTGASRRPCRLASKDVSALLSQTLERSTTPGGEGP